MKQPAVACLIVTLAATAPTLASGDGLLPIWEHPGNEVIRDSGYAGAQTCAICHPDALGEITHSVHWYLASQVRNVEGLPDGTWWGMVDRECALAGTTALANWLGSTDGKYTPQSAGCGMCHIAALSEPPFPPGREATAAEANTVDCLVCHAGAYDMSARRRLVTAADGSSHWGQDQSMESALSVTRTPSREACLRCHEHSFSEDYKRGTPFAPDTDVHAAVGLTCVTCHLTRKHKIAKGQWESDMVANDLPDEPVTCSNCHGLHPHRGDDAGFLDTHAARIACQTCHVPVVSGIVAEDWGKPVQDDLNGRFSELSWFESSPAISGLWVPEVTIRGGHPSYMWRVANTGDNKQAQSWMAFATASRGTDGAMILPARGLKQVLLFDGKLAMWQAPGMDFLKKEKGMADFPLLLAPDRAVYNQTGDVKRAIEAGMEPYTRMGLHWSGEWKAMAVPGTSYISVNHSVRRIGLRCIDCHSPHGVLDFAALGFADEEVRKLEISR
jgi:hypothetical protein